MGWASLLNGRAMIILISPTGVITFPAQGDENFGIKLNNLRPFEGKPQRFITEETASGQRG